MIDIEAIKEGRVRRPEDFWPVEERYREAYDDAVAVGRDNAALYKLAVVMIARTSCPHLRNTLSLVGELLDGPWRKTAFFAYENDSADETPDVLAEFCGRRGDACLVSESHNTPDERGFEPERTHRLARARNHCAGWVAKNAGDFEYVCVLDSDPHGGFSVDGVYNSLGWYAVYQSSPAAVRKVGALASFSLYVEKAEDYCVAHYDAYAARLNWWENRGSNTWFHSLMPPVGSKPIQMNSAFGGLCLYTRDAYRSLRYEGGDCEHVLAHRAMHAAGHTLALNPGSRYVAILP
jgi:hypothetical protein